MSHLMDSSATQARNLQDIFNPLSPEFPTPNSLSRSSAVTPEMSLKSVGSRPCTLPAPWPGPPRFSLRQFWQAPDLLGSHFPLSNLSSIPRSFCQSHLSKTQMSLWHSPSEYSQLSKRWSPNFLVWHKGLSGSSLCPHHSLGPCHSLHCWAASSVQGLSEPVMPLPSSKHLHFSTPSNMLLPLPGISLNLFSKKPKLETSLETQLREETVPTSQSRGGPFTAVSPPLIVYTLIPICLRDSITEVLRFSWTYLGHLPTGWKQLQGGGGMKLWSLCSIHFQHWDGIRQILKMCLWNEWVKHWKQMNGQAWRKY